MRIRLVLPAVALSVGALMASNATGATGGKSVKCGGGSETFLFWPKGHGEIKSVNFANYPVRHLEAYKTGAGFPGSNFRAFIDYKGTVSTSKSCKSTPSQTVSPSIKNKRTTTATTQLVCKFSKSSRYTLNAAGAGDFRVIDGSALMVDAHVSLPAKLSYNSKKCTAKPPPS
jgi:hypothetical protein